MKQIVLTTLLACTMYASAQTEKVELVSFDCKKQYQTMHSFGASDCWRTQYIGKNWPVEKRENIADLLFCSDFHADGNPKGIGLSMWRFNIGSGSHEAGDKGGVSSDWRRTECFLDLNGDWDWTKQAGQRWFLDAARKRKIPYTLGFTITAPYFMTRNGMCRASDDAVNMNIMPDKYNDYAQFLARTCQQLSLDYISPVNEPQWDWTGAGQEGTPATNEDCFRLIEALDGQLKGSKTQIVFGEAGDIRYLYRKETNKQQRDNQIEELFATKSPKSILNLAHVAPIVSGHSYWSTYPMDTLISLREELSGAIRRHLPSNVSYWQTEYCPMEQNADNPNGGGQRDLGMNTALYIARVIHHDLTVANAASWQSWTAFTEWDYKDGLIYIDDGQKISGAQRADDAMVNTCKSDGEFRTSKYMWALGNYSLFVRPGMIRIGHADGDDYSAEQAYGLMSSAYMDRKCEKVSVVLINYGESPRQVSLSVENAKIKKKSWNMYVTSDHCNLNYTGKVKMGAQFLIPSRSVVTLTNINYGSTD